MNTSAISLVTPVLNCAGSLERTLRSVLAQSLCPAEHIIVDGMSTDGSTEICLRYKASAPYPVRILRREPRRASDALNAGFAECRHEITGLLHGADLFPKGNVLEKMQGAFEADPALQVAYADIRYLDVKGKPGRYYSGRPFRPSLLKWGYMFPHPSMYVRRALFSRYGPYATDYLIAGDFEWLVRVLLKGGEKYGYVPVCAVLMNPGGVSARTGNRLRVTPREKLKALRANGIHVCPLRLVGRYAFALADIFRKGERQ